MVLAAIVGGGVAVLADKHQELTGALHLLDYLRWGWVVAAAGAEALSLGPFARLQRWMFRAGGVNLGFWSTVWVTLAGNALGTSLPGGVAWSTVWMFREFRRRGADRPLTVWALLMAGVISGVVLFVLLVVGLWLVGGRGPLAVLRWPALGVTVGGAAVLVVIVIAIRRHEPGALIAGSLGTALRRWSWTAGAIDDVAELESRVRSVLSRPSSWVQVVVMAAANWLLDCTSLVGCILALRGAVPWRSILVIYAMTEIAASIPISPGGLGVVEASLALLLVAYGVRGEVAIATVALYRLMSFWGLDGVGWLVWLVLSVDERRARRRPSLPDG
ncbi:MAG: lysylphosphatidylglycerol synthase transmembrane domain-containing protein [Acidimicrobiales bacterium]